MIRALSFVHELDFARPATTSRGTLLRKRIHYLAVSSDCDLSLYGIGECSLFPGLSVDDRPGFEAKVRSVCEEMNSRQTFQVADLMEWPSIAFGLEVALRDLEMGGQRLLYPSAFTLGEDSLPINGLIWMGSYADMQRQIKEKLLGGFRCLKLKIGALEIAEELSLLRAIRKEFSTDALELRVDANGAFAATEAASLLDQLAELGIHSIEQPIKPGQQEAMAKLCAESPVPIALDEELIALRSRHEKEKVLQSLRPHYIILKPGLLGGLKACEEWISIAKPLGIGWWVTSALETNIGLNAIAQWTYTLGSSMPQGLGTGQMFKNNIPSPLILRGDRLFYQPDRLWDLETLLGENHAAR